MLPPYLTCLSIPRMGLPLAQQATKLSVALCFSLALTAIADSPSLPGVRIGLLLPAREAAARSIRQGAELSAQMASDQLGIPIRILARAPAGQWGGDGEEAAQLVLDENVDALIAPPEGIASHLLLQVSGRTSVPVATLCPDSSVTRAGIPWMVRVAPRTDEQARALFQGLARGAVRPSRWIALVPPERPGREAARDLREAAGATGNQLVGIVAASTQPVDWAADANRLLTNRPDAVLLWLDADAAANAARALRDAGFAGLLAGPACLQTPAFTAAAGKAAEGVVSPETVRSQAKESAFARFQSCYQARFGCLPDYYAALAHDAVTWAATKIPPPPAPAPHGPSHVVSAKPSAEAQLMFDLKGNCLRQLGLSVCRGGVWVRDPRTDTKTN